MNFKIVFVLATTLCMVSATATASQPSTLCSSDELLLFSCHTNKKLISICASKDAASGHGYMQYRFGSSEKIEMTVPFDKSVPPKDSATVHQFIYSGGGGISWRFKAANYDYVVCSESGKGWGEKEDVAIEKNGHRISHSSCIDESLGNYSYYDFVDDKKFGLKEDVSDFDLP